MAIEIYITAWITYILVAGLNVMPNWTQYYKNSIVFQIDQALNTSAWIKNSSYSNIIRYDTG